METAARVVIGEAADMCSPPIPRLIPRAREILAAADDDGIDVRALGGVAIYLRASEAGRTALGREYGDIDLVGRRKQSRNLRRLLEELGYSGQQLFNATHGDRRLIYEHVDPEHRIDVFLDVFEMCHTFALADRLTIDALTLPCAELLMTKLQVVEINAKDLSDGALLLLDHEPSDQDGTGRLNVVRIAELCAADWGLYTTLTDNLQKLGRYAPRLDLAAEQLATVVDRAAVVLDAIDRAPKTLRWKARARVGRRVPWHDTPEEIG
jgi:hypothetical protein